MSMAHGKIKKKYNLTDERAALLEQLQVWVDAVRATLPTDFLSLVLKVDSKRIFQLSPSLDQRQVERRPRKRFRSNQERNLVAQVGAKDFRGGSEPDASDVAVFGALRGLSGVPLHAEVRLTEPRKQHHCYVQTVPRAQDSLQYRYLHSDCVLITSSLLLSSW